MAFPNITERIRRGLPKVTSTVDLGPPSPFYRAPWKANSRSRGRGLLSSPPAALPCIALRSWVFLPSQVVLYEGDPHGRLWIRLDDLQTAVANFLTRLD